MNDVWRRCIVRFLDFVSLVRLRCTCRELRRLRITWIPEYYIDTQTLTWFGTHLEKLTLFPNIGPLDLSHTSLRRVCDMTTIRIKYPQTLVRYTGNHVPQTPLTHLVCKLRAPLYEVPETVQVLEGIFPNKDFRHLTKLRKLKLTNPCKKLLLPPNCVLTVDIKDAPSPEWFTHLQILRTQQLQDCDLSASRIVKISVKYASNVIFPQTLKSLKVADAESSVQVSHLSLIKLYCPADVKVPETVENLQTGDSTGLCKLTRLKQLILHGTHPDLKLPTSLETLVSYVNHPIDLSGLRLKNLHIRKPPSSRYPETLVNLSAPDKETDISYLNLFTLSVPRFQDIPDSVRILLVENNAIDITATKAEIIYVDGFTELPPTAKKVYVLSEYGLKRYHRFYPWVKVKYIHVYDLKFFKKYLNYESM